jgi:hypothetical protein
MNRRNYLALMGAAAGALATSKLVSAQDPGAPTTSSVEDRARRMKWWHEAKFKVTAVTMHGTNTPVKFEQDDFRIRLVGLPKRAPEFVTTSALECDSEPRQSHEGKRAEKPRDVSA